MKTEIHDGKKVKIWKEDEFFKLASQGKIQTKLTKEITPYRNPLGNHNPYASYEQE